MNGSRENIWPFDAGLHLYFERSLLSCSFSKFGVTRSEFDVFPKSCTHLDVCALKWQG
jgi:hypothetical protein